MKVIQNSRHARLRSRFVVTKQFSRVIMWSAGNNQNGSIKFLWIFEDITAALWQHVEWTDLAQDSDKWLADVNAAMNSATPQRAGQIWKKQGNCQFLTSPNFLRVIKSRRMRWAGHVAHMGEERGVYRVLVGKPEGKRPLGRPRCRWVDNIIRILLLIIS